MLRKMEPGEIHDLAKKLTGIASECVALASNLSASFETGTANFEGNTKNRYVESFAEMKPIIAEKLPALISDFAGELDRTATNWETLDG